ncbi:hypothetical protein FAZ69_15380 [Trinickia terrae]|uniref:Uncharacterized protein n=1 Tax=Trinickia terrae TaxID=2571161 RepID=A0A4U1I3B1_9BURK|nr:hypothetical protein [Trinickia terrae]TKC87675.1 hypothetical protein FAZ69_15380 [Trinickia terrae]
MTAAERARIPLSGGPKWICRIASEPADRRRWRNNPLPVGVAQTLLKLRPADVPMQRIEERERGLLAIPKTDDHGTYRGYAYLAPDRSIEMAGVIGVGPWADQERTWWPGAYELPMLKMLPTAVRTLLDQLLEGVTPFLFMALADIAGTALVTESEGMERPFAIPPGIDTVHFDPVRLDDAPGCRSAVETSFNRIRELAGLKNVKPFYF